MSKLWTIARNTFRESLRKKTLLILLVFAFIVMGASRFFSFLTAEEEMKMLKDVSFSAIEFFGALLAIFAALVAAQLYSLIKAGEVARAWRSFIVGALVFAAWSLTSFANTFFPFVFEEGRRIGVVMDLLQTLFILLFAVGLWLQRQMFYHPGRFRRELRRLGGDEDEDDEDALLVPSEQVA